MQPGGPGAEAPDQGRDAQLVPIPVDGSGSTEYNQFLVRAGWVEEGLRPVAAARCMSHTCDVPTCRRRPGTSCSCCFSLECCRLQVCGSLFECPAKYLPIKPIGKGAYGVVW